MSCHQLQPSVFHLKLLPSLSLPLSLPRLVSSIVFYLKTRGTCDLRLGRLSGDAAKLDSGLVLNLSSSRNRKQKTATEIASDAVAVTVDGDASSAAAASASTAAHFYQKRRRCCCCCCCCCLICDKLTQDCSYFIQIM